MSDLLEFAKNIALQAGEIMRENFMTDMEVIKKANNTPVTIADTKINELVIETVKKSYPHHSILGEEASHQAAESEYTWVCDPIDGTIAYTFGLATNVFSLILAHHGIPELGVVYDPHLKRMYTAQKGKGAYRDNKIIKVNNLPLKEAVVGCTSKNSAIVNAPNLHADIEKACFRIMYLGCTVYEGVLVASGHLAGHVFVGNGAHDGIASALFITEAGGRVTDLFGNEQRYDEPLKGVIATNGIIHDEILKLVQNNLLREKP